MTARRIVVGVALVVLAIGAQQAYVRFSNARPPIAQATLVVPNVDQHGVDAAESWQQTRVGSELLAGDTVRTGANARAEFRLFPNGILKVGSGALLRFVLGDGQTSTNHLILETGDAEIIAGLQGWGFETQFGLAMFDPGSEVRLVSANGTMKFELVVGHGVISRRDERVDVGAGETLTFDLAGNVIARSKPTAAEEKPAEVAPVPAEEPPSSDAVRLEVKGENIRVRGAGESSWSEFAGGGPHEVSAGSTVKAGRGSTVTVLRGAESVVVQGVSAMTIGASAAPLISVDEGQLTSVPASADTSVAVAGGVVEMRKHSDTGAVATLVVTRTAARVHVRAGVAELKGTKDTFVVRPGDTASLRRDGSIESTVEPPKHADIAIKAAESPVIHERGKSVALNVDFGDVCPHGGVVEVATSGRDFEHPYMVSRGEHSAHIGLAGTGRYRVRCVEGGAVAPEARKQGTIQIVHDSGEVVLPKRPSENVLDADGRRYTVLYQNFLPVLHFRWRAAKVASGLTLRIRGKGVEKSLPASGAERTVASGELDEGDYTWWFESTSDAKSESPPTQLRIDFDNAAPTVYLREPKDGAFKVGEKVRVSGAALKDWSVQVNGQAVPIDGQFRFSTEAEATATQRAISIRLAHPDHGVHYYLRRARGD